MSDLPHYLQARHEICPDDDGADNDGADDDGVGIGPTRIFYVIPASAPQKIGDRLPWWLDQVLQGCMAAQEVDRAYGRGSKTRPRRSATFGDYIKERIRWAEAPETAREVLDLLIHVSRDDWHGQARSAVAVRVNRLLTTTGKATAERLRELLVQLDDPTT